MNEKSLRAAREMLRAARVVQLNYERFTMAARDFVDSENDIALKAAYARLSVALEPSIFVFKEVQKKLEQWINDNST